MTKVDETLGFRAVRSAEVRRLEGLIGLALRPLSNGALPAVGSSGSMGVGSRHMPRPVPNKRGSHLAQQVSNRSVHGRVYWQTEAGICQTPGGQLAGSGGLF